MKLQFFNGLIRIINGLVHSKLGLARTFYYPREQQQHVQAIEDAKNNVSRIVPL